MVRLSALGDVIQVLPAIEALAQRFPDAKIDAVTETLSYDLLDGHPALRNVLELPRAKARAAWRDQQQRGQTWPLLERFIRQLRTEHYDLMIDWQSNLRSALVRMLARKSRVIGIHPQDGGELPRWWPGFRPAQAAGKLRKVHRVERALHVIKELGWTGITPQGQLGTADQDFIDGDPGIRAPILLHPFVSAFGRFKEWPLYHWTKLARSLATKGYPVWISGAPDDRPRIAQLVQQCGYCAAPAPGTSGIKQLMGLVKHCRAVVAADTGVLHLAAALQIPAIGLYGPKDPQIHGPWGSRSTLLRGEVPCAPCTLRSCEHSFCMQSIAPDRVESTLLDLLASATGSVDPAPC